MRRTGVILAAGIAAVLAWPGAASAQAPAAQVSFSKEIVPIFKSDCAQCHNSRQPQGGLSLSSFADLEKGGKGGKVLAPRASDSRLIKYLEGTLKPQMPIGGKLTPQQIAKFRAWIDQGAKPDVDPKLVVIPDSAILAVKVPVIPLKVPMLPQAAGLAWSKDNAILAVGTYQTVILFNPQTGEKVRELKGHADVVHDVQFSPDGKYLAAAGGPPAQQGEIKIWEVATGKPVRTIVGHSDYIYSCSWSPDSAQIASASYDKTVKIWEVATGNEVRTLKDNADAVYAVAFSPKGDLLATGSADRSVKVWEVKSGKRLYTLTGHTDVVYAVAWNAAGTQVTSCGADKTIRTWNANASAGQQARNVTGHQKSVNAVVYSADGNMLCSVSDDLTAKVWNAGNGSTMQTLKDVSDALLSAAFSPDGQLVAVGGFDGTVRVFNVGDGKLLRTLIDVPKAPEKPAAAPPAAAPADKKPPALDPKKPASTAKAGR